MEILHDLEKPTAMRRERHGSNFRSAYLALPPPLLLAINIEMSTADTIWPAILDTNAFVESFKIIKNANNILLCIFNKYFRKSIFFYLLFKLNKY